LTISGYLGLKDKIHPHHNMSNTAQPHFKNMLIFKAEFTDTSKEGYNSGYHRLQESSVLWQRNERTLYLYG
jgi:hypothetical protein